MDTSSSNRGTRADRPGGSKTVAILVNVVWIVEHLDGNGLAELRDVPVLELAKHISIPGETA